jgi:hypothetical protein
MELRAAVPAAEAAAQTAREAAPLGKKHGVEFSKAKKARLEREAAADLAEAGAAIAAAL